MIRCGIASALLVWLGLIGSFSAARAQPPLAVEPTDLGRRFDLVGKTIEVDDRVAFFQFHRDEGFDEIYLKRCPDVVFWLPKRLRPASNPQPPAVRIRGVVQREGERLRVEVDSFDLMPADLDRLNASVATLSKLDFAARNAWVQWAERRAASFKDDALRKRAREIEAETIRAEADRVPRGTNPARYWLGLADRGGARGLPESETGALIHRAARAMLAESKAVDQLEATLREIESRRPSARDVPTSVPPDLASWQAAYDRDPANTYRTAPTAVRAIFDRRLYADALIRLIDRRADDDPRLALDAADEAARRLPDRPEVAARLIESGLAAVTSDVASLAYDQVARAAALYRDRLGRPDQGRELLRAWLLHQRRSIAAGDADWRLRLADRFESEIGDRTTAISLIREAYGIDPKSSEVDTAFRSRGYRKQGDQWVLAASKPTADSTPDASVAARSDEPGTTQAAQADAPRTSSTRPRSDSLLGATPERVRSELGLKPDRRSWSATQGQVAEQWIFSLPDRDMYVTFSARSGERHARVTSVYTLPRRSRGDR